ncbi:hypothetical protein AB0C87_24895 [Actinomadura sp. NPDC048021]|uniref:hypothetical protein n=1 Tax=Actinomadura sp. NPDC048021 TaxID=3155385 RepID=UPI0033D6C1BA
MVHGGNAIWGGSRVRLLMPHNNVRQGSEGTNLGRRQDGDTLVALDDGREEYLPIALLERINKEEYVEDAIQWKSFPERKVWHPHNYDKVQEETGRGDYVYQFRGFSGKWYVMRTHAPTGNTARTRFYPNQRLAKATFDHLVNE